LCFAGSSPQPLLCAPRRRLLFRRCEGVAAAFTRAAV